MLVVSCASSMAVHLSRLLMARHELVSLSLKRVGCSTRSWTAGWHSGCMCSQYGGFVRAL